MGTLLTTCPHRQPRSLQQYLLVRRRHGQSMENQWCLWAGHSFPHLATFSPAFTLSSFSTVTNHQTLCHTQLTVYQNRVAEWNKPYSWQAAEVQSRLVTLTRDQRAPDSWLAGMWVPRGDGDIPVAILWILGARGGNHPLEGVLADVSMPTTHTPQ